jgi:uncharacterized protein (TIGR02118 family)
MIVRMGLLRRRPDISRDQFRKHWRDVHGPLAKQMPKLRGYHQNHIVDDRQLGVDHARGTWDIDGISELWFDNAEEMEAAIASPAYQPVRDDSPAFLAETRVVTIEQRTVKAFDGTSKAIKRMSLLKRKPELTPEQFRHEWFEVHGELVRAFPTLLGYRQNLILTRQSDPDAGGDYATVPADGIVEMWFADEAALQASFNHEAAVRSQTHAHSFLSEITPFLVEVHQVV